MRILHFTAINDTGARIGFSDRLHQEYIVILEDDDTDTINDHTISGFKLSAEFNFDEDGQPVYSLPCSRTLISD